MRFALLLSSLFLLAACSGGEEESSNSGVHHSRISMLEIWARTSRPPHANSAAFLRVKNSGGIPLQLLSASTPRAGITELHSMEVVDDTMKMRRVDSFPIAVGETLTLEPGGNHLMFFNLDEPWIEGQMIPITLEFSEGHTIKLDAEVIVQ